MLGSEPETGQLNLAAGRLPSPWLRLARGRFTPTNHPMPLHPEGVELGVFTHWALWKGVRVDRPALRYWPHRNAIGWQSDPVSHVPDAF